jgi:NADH dehydrogenase
MGDIGDSQSLAQALEGIDTVIHLVGIIKETKGATFESIHAEGTRNVIASSLSAGAKRLLYLSALGTRADARSRYHQTKWQAEEAVRNSELRYLILRPSIICGQGDKFVNLFAEMIRRMPILALPASRARLQPIFVNDLVFCMLKALADDSVWNQALEVAGPDRLTLQDIVLAIMEQLGKRRPVVRIPMPAMRLVAQFVERFHPDPPLTRDQLLSLTEDNTCDISKMRTAFAIEPSPFRNAIASYLKRH